MGKLNASEIIDLVEKLYFRSVDTKNLDQVLNCFAEDASLTVKTAGVTYRGRDAEIRSMFENVMKDIASIYHGDFCHVIDVENQRIASQFLVKNGYDDGTHEEKRNCNFFEIQNGIFSSVSVYMTGENTLA